jgi:AcrR family transcriptional regulator
MGQTARVPARRTQQERREETIARLLDATASTIHDLGYAHTTVQEICTRAGLSQGALFRHFPSRRAVLVATAERVARHQTAEFAARFAGTHWTPDTLVDALRLLRSQVRSPSNQVWHELVRAARTDHQLREDLAPALRDYHRRTGLAAAAFARELFPWDDDLQAALRITVSCLDGEAAVAEVMPDEERDDATLAMLAQFLQSRFVPTQETIS